MRRECRERFPRPPQVSDPDMHHGTCVTHVPWCMPGLLTSGFLWSWWRGKHSWYSWRMPMSSKIYSSKFTTISPALGQSPYCCRGTWWHNTCKGCFESRFQYFVRVSADHYSLSFINQWRHNGLFNGLAPNGLQAVTSHNDINQGPI